ncbi:MAG: hypothetical protein DRJ31_05460 [Candidatus Methanomethylicota archaeon]|uniref:ATPase AAA-type core domain-containing protein n=1 Tax=Thermoproteota archaeon TaxID=2056631 RepID=A0A497EPH7_9CREN|nr:MAG: hypothetical protein DRJ31_05460 [Candidatus Verstraetearchaeota archaeon]
MEPYIRKVALWNFRGIRGGVLEFAPLTILVGANNCGKSTILEALFLGAGLSRKTPYVPYMAVEVVNNLHRTLHSGSYAFLVHNYTAPHAFIVLNVEDRFIATVFLLKENHIRVEYLVAGEETRLDVALERVVTKGSGGTKLCDLDLNSNKVSDINKWDLITSKDILIFHPKLVNEAYEFLKGYWPEVKNKRVSMKIVELVSRISNERYVNLTLEPFYGGQLALYAQRPDGSSIRVGDLGDGVQELLIAGLLYEMVKPGVLLWDDFESHMNPKALVESSLWLTELVEKGTQVVVSTHSLEALRCLAKTAVEHVGEEYVSITLLSLVNGELKAKKMSLEEVEKLQAAGVDVRMAEAALF